MINGFKCGTTPPPIGYSGKLTIIPITDGNTLDSESLSTESSETVTTTAQSSQKEFPESSETVTTTAQSSQKEFPKPTIYSNPPNHVTRPNQLINSQTLRDMTKNHADSLAETIKALKTSAKSLSDKYKNGEGTTVIDSNDVQQKPRDCAEANGDFKTPNKGWAQQEGLRMLNASNFCTYDKKCYFDVTVNEKTSITRHENLYRNKSHPPTKCLAAKECESSRIKDIKKVNNTYSHAVLPACYVTEANTTNEVYFDQVNPGELINNSAIRCDTEQAMPWSGSSKRTFGGGVLELCSLQSLLLRGACEDRTCSKYDLSSR